MKRCRIGRDSRFDPGFQPGLREHLERAREIQYLDVLEEENADVDLPTGGAFCSVHTDGLAPNRTGVKASLFFPLGPQHLGQRQASGPRGGDQRGNGRRDHQGHRRCDKCPRRQRGHTTTSWAILEAECIGSVGYKDVLLEPSLNPHKQSILAP